MKTNGSQKRELLSESGMTLHIDNDGLSFLSGMQQDIKDSVILKNETDGNLELWTKNDHFAGYVIEIDGIGYEFVRTIT